MQAANTAVQPIGLAAVPIDVSQGLSNVAVPSLGDRARILPQPLGYNVNPNPVTLAEVPQIWGFRRELWNRFRAGFAGTTEANGSWFQSVGFFPCAFHFEFSGAAFEVLFAGTRVNATLIADGKYATPRYISRSLQGGVEGPALQAYDTYVRFDFGTPAVRRISLYCYSSLGPSAFAIGAADTLSAWDRSAEPSMAGQADSYGAAVSSNWPFSAIFFEAAMRMGIPNAHIDAVGGTGYAPNNVFTNPADSFLGRLPAMTQAPPDLFITAGGINDNNDLPLAPYATGDEARVGFETAVRRYFQALRAALPNTVLAALGPWQPDASFYPQSGLDKAATIRAAMQSVAGPWVFIDNLQGGWIASSGAWAPASGAGWQTGTGNMARPRGDGNGDLYVSGDGVHPSLEGSRYLGEQLAANLRAAIATL